MIRLFKDLEVFQESYQLALLVNKEVLKLPAHERNDLASQLSRASKSIPANIAEGWAKRRFPKEFKHHLDVSLGSCNEMEVHIQLAKDFAYWSKDLCDELAKRYIQLGGKLVRLRENWKTF